MDFSSFLTSLATSFVIFFILMCLFTWLSRRPGNHVIYYPNRILRGLDPYEGTRVSRNPFAWIREALTSTEADVIRMSGVDSAVYFVFLSTGLTEMPNYTMILFFLSVLGIFVFSGLYLLPVLLPLAATAHAVLKANNSTSQRSFNDLDKLSMSHIEQKSPRLWAFVIGTYWVSFVTYCLLWKAYKHVSDLRAAALMSPEVSNEQFAVLVRDIPPVPEGQTRKDQVDSYFKAIYPDTFYRSLVVTDSAKLNTIYEKLEGYKKKLTRAETISAANPQGPRPTKKTGFLGLIGEKVDAIEYYDKKIKELILKLEAEQKVILKDKQQCAAVIFFNNRLTAAAASQCLHDTMVDTWTVMEAPESREMMWTNLHKNFYERQIRQYIVYFIVFLAIFFYMIPIGIISAFTTLENLKKLLPFLKPILDTASVRSVLGAYLPQLALIIFLAMLPKFLLFLSKLEGIPSQSHAERAASGKYFYFIVLNVFIGVTLGSSLFSKLKDIEDDPKSVFRLLAMSLPGSATFFLTFVALKFFVGYGLELARIVPLIVYHLKKKFVCKTEADLKEAWAPGSLGYATRIPGDMLIATIVLCYSVIAPLIIPFGVAYFGLGWVLLRNQVLKVYVPSYESYGKMWPHMYKRIVASLILYQVTMLGYFILKQFIFTPVLIPLPILSLIFVYVCNKKFYRSFQSTALDVARRELKENPNLEVVFKSFLPPSLRYEKGGGDEDEFEDPLSHGSRTNSRSDMLSLTADGYLRCENWMREMNPRSEVNAVLKKEAAFFGDIEILPFMDRYELVVPKTVATCEYGVRNVSTSYIMKCDDDTFIRLETVLKEIEAVSPRRSLYLGNLNLLRKPLRIGKWAFSYEEWPEEIYPPYTNGRGYVIPSDIAKYIVSQHASHSLRLFKMEDVSMGMWVEQFNSIVNVQYSHNWKFCQYRCMQDYYTAHYQSPRQLICLWDNLMKGRAHCCNV
ncbi:hypothetical protein BUALT_Bualt03G0021900 [Buddleja alternifolia]|uniref:Uncharacterized protein n=1 Tax=Buddleja alternifolia TaxID=168488 RepID=A0AAV6XQJ2_9LAMI|nr:hypothetical protein BUALT_Bualt03G0021900 [Buddleja alternifolia]